MPEKGWAGRTRLVKQTGYNGVGSGRSAVTWGVCNLSKSDQQLLILACWGHAKLWDQCCLI